MKRDQWPSALLVGEAASGQAGSQALEKRWVPLGEQVACAGEELMQEGLGPTSGMAANIGLHGSLRKKRGCG